MKPYLYIASTIAFTVYGQLIIKWRINRIGFIINTDDLMKNLLLYLKFLFDPFIFTGFLSAFIASVFWILAMTKFELTRVYPFMSLSPALVFLLGKIVLGETYTLGKIAGLVLIITGIIITVRY